MRTIKVRSVVFVIVVHAGCDKQDSLVRGRLRGKRTYTLSAINCPTVDRRNCWSHSNSPKARYWSRIAIFAYHICIRRPVRVEEGGGFPSEYNHNVWYGKAIELTGEKVIFEIYLLVSTVHERDVQTDTDRRHRPRLYIASRGKMHTQWWIKSCTHLMFQVTAQ